MSIRPNQPGDATPPPLNEEHMLEWVEGRLSRIEEGNRAAATRAGVSERVKQMQANRRAMQSLGDERAPAELMDRVLAALEREALLGLSNGEAVDDHPPINLATHTVTVRRSRRLEKWAPGLALAAGLALLVGGAVYWGSMLVKPESNQRPGTGEIATNDGKGEVKPLPDQGTQVATNTDAIKPDAGMTTLMAPAASDKEEPTLVASAPMSDERILQLAREGRLVIRVGATDVRKLAQIEALQTLENGRTWRVSKDVPSEILASVLPPKFMRTRSTEPTDHALATSSNGEAAAPAPTMKATGSRVPEFPHVQETYLVDFLDTQKSLTAVRVTFADRLKAGVVFEELEQPLVLPRVEEPDAMLWWTLPPSSWTQRVTVPVVVEGK